MPFFNLSGLAIRGVTFGAGTGAAIGKREIASQADANPKSYKANKSQDDQLTFWQGRKIKAHKISRVPLRQPLIRYWTTRKPTTPPPTPTPAQSHASIERNFDLPQNITFVLCFWIKTTATSAQLMSVIEKTREPTQNRWRRINYYYYYYYWKPKEKENNIIDVSIFRRMLRLHIGYKRTERFVFKIRIYHY